jgi:outer membrane translocation and assembly module TamA
LIPHRRLRFEGSASLLNLRIGPGERSPSIESFFSPGEAPGLARQPEFYVYRGSVQLDLRDRELPAVGALLEAGVERYDDHTLGQFDFTRLYGEVQLQVPLGYRNRRLALRLRTSHDSPDRGHEVPFYLMETVGGAKTIRGFAEYRFRDRRNLLLNVEYRWEVWSYVDAAVFADFGKAFRDDDDLDLSDLQRGYGFGIRMHFPNLDVVRFDVARSREGIKLHISGGPSF